MKKSIVCLLLILIPKVSLAQTPGVYKVIVEKQEEKKRSRWTLADWLQQKQNNRAMDLWLAKNSYSSPFEFYLDGSMRNYDYVLASTPKDHENFNAQGGELGAFAGRAGIRASFYGDEEKRSVWQSGLNFRVYGRAVQDTHINVEWGLRGQTVQENEREHFQNQFGAVTLNLYLTKFFGLEGQYARILPARSNLDRSLEGETSTAGVYIDFSALRVYGEWRNEHLVTKTPDDRIAETRSGFGGGLRFFF